jgi:hypothetical protein
MLTRNKAESLNGRGAGNGCYGLGNGCYGLGNGCYGLGNGCYGLGNGCYGLGNGCYGLVKIGLKRSAVVEAFGASVGHQADA